MKHLGDITKINGAEIPKVDVITGGSPCQDLSVAGKRAGLAGERSHLFMEQIRIVKEMREDDRKSGRAADYIRPRFMVWENVPGAFSSNKGEDFRAVLTEIVRIAEPKSPAVPLPARGGWSKFGCLYDAMGRWSIAWRVHDAQFWGVAQRRKRISVVADFGGLSAPEVCFERKGLCWDTQESGEARERTAAASEGCTGAAISFQERAGKPGGGKGILIQNERTGALSTLNNQSVFAYGISSYDSNAMKSKNPNSGIYEAETARTLDLNGGNPACNQGGIAIVQVLNEEHGHQPIIVEMTSTKNEVSDSGISPTLTARMGTGGNQVNAVYCAEVGFFTAYEETAGTLLARQYKDPPVINASIPRRLTPTECERLQGYPDGWTDIGEWTDSKGRKRKSLDSMRYKALGNSIALPYWFYILRRIAAQYERPATLGSLFDGIGGFPLCWERCNGPGFTLWASEIEDFPIAVTKYHFGEE